MRGIGGGLAFLALTCLLLRQLTRHKTGHAQATVRYSDFNLAIPNVPSVTGVSETTTLALAFTAKTA